MYVFYSTCTFAQADQGILNSYGAVEAYSTEFFCMTYKTFFWDTFDIKELLMHTSGLDISRSYILLLFLLLYYLF